MHFLQRIIRAKVFEHMYVYDVLTVMQQLFTSNMAAYVERHHCHPMYTVNIPIRCS